MIKLRIPKKTPGQFREICSPSAAEKNSYRKFLPILNNIAAQKCSPDIVHGFMEGKSPVTNATAHIGFKYTLRFDLSDFFDCVKPEHVRDLIPEEVIKSCFYEDRAYQGLPTSPPIANIAGSKIDSGIVKILPSGVKYTRYADDLTFSFDDYSLTSFLKNEIPKVVESCGFKVNHKKTWLQDSRFGGRRITGILVGDSSIRVPRSIRRKMRAAHHQNNIFSASGLQEWSRLKIPNSANLEKAKWERFIAPFKIKDRPFPRNIEREVVGDFVITSDPYYLLGANQFTDGWNDLLEVDSYRARELLKEVQDANGVQRSRIKIVLLLSDRDIAVRGIVRKGILARAYIFKSVYLDRYTHLMGRDNKSIKAIKDFLSVKKFQMTNSFCY